MSIPLIILGVVLLVVPALIAGVVLIVILCEMVEMVIQNWPGLLGIAAGALGSWCLYAGLT